MIRTSRNFRRDFDLLVLLTRNEIVLKYKRTMLGVVWSLLTPLCMAMIYYFAFVVVMPGKRPPNFTFHLLSGLFPWMLFTASVSRSARILGSNADLLKRVRFPRVYLVVATIVSQSVFLLASVPILIGLSYHYGGGPSLTWLIGVPVLLVVFCTMTMACSVLVALANAYFRDMEHIIELVLRMLFWLTPVVYTIDMVPKSFRPFYDYNPLAGTIVCWQKLFQNNELVWSQVGLSWAISLPCLVLAVLLFKRVEPKLDEIL